MKNQQHHFLVLCVLLMASYNMSCSSIEIKTNFVTEEEAEPERLETITGRPLPEGVLIVHPVVREVASEPKSMNCSNFALPQKLKIKIVKEAREKKLFIVNEADVTVAHIEQTRYGVSQYKIIDMKNQVIMSGRENKLSHAVLIDLYDCTGQRVGRIVQDVEKSFVSAEASYNVLDTQDKILFQAERKSEDSSVIDLLDRNEAPWASLVIARTTNKFEARALEPMSAQNSLMLIATLKQYAEGAR